MSDLIPGFTSTGSKRPESLFGSAHDASLPARMLRSQGCRVWDTEGREYIDCIMALGAVGLGYAHPEVNRAAAAALDAGVVGSLGPALEEELAVEIRRAMPWIEGIRFLKTGAEACAAAVRLARVFTGREHVLGCGYHGWLDWCAPGEGVPKGTRAVFAELPFNDVERTRALIRGAGERLACVMFEPVIEGEPDREWLDVVRSETERTGALLVVDEVKAVCRIAIGGGTERYGLRPDLVVLGKALANGFPLAAVGGRADVMQSATRTWISSTLATELVSLAAARATLSVVQRERVPETLRLRGARLHSGLRQLAGRHEALVTAVRGIPEMCHLALRNEADGFALAAGCARRGVLFKRSAYNFVSLAHDEAAVDQVLAVVAEVLSLVSGER